MSTEMSTEQNTAAGPQGVTVHTTARVVTDRPARYGKQLASHMNRKANGVWDAETESGSITFGETAIARMTSEPGFLVFDVEAPADELERYESVVGRHLVRFGAKDELEVIWTRADGSQGTSQRNEGEDEAH